MKTSEPLEQNRIRQQRIRSIGGKGVSRTQSVKLSTARKTESAGPLEEHCRDSETHTVTFEYFNPAAREVLVVGSFNDWQAQGRPMTKMDGGWWALQILLRPGQYEYRFVVDGEWLDDPKACRFVANPFGGQNCVLEVKATPSSAGRQP